MPTNNGAPVPANVGTTGETLLSDHTPEFPTSRKGYEPAAVDAYLAQVRDELVGLRDDLAKARDELGVAGEELAATQTELDELRGNIDEARSAAADEARSLLENAQATASATTEAAERRASEIVAEAERSAEDRLQDVGREEEEMRERLRTRENEITAELDEIDARVGERNRLIGDLETRLAAEEARYAERIHVLETVAKGLEDALRAVAEGSLLELGVFLETQRAAVVDNDIVGAAVHHHFTTDALLAAAPKPPIAPKHTREDADVPETQTRRPDDAPRPPRRNDDQGSFYSRRSARLPSMAEGQGQSILAAMGALRKDDDSDGDDESESQ